MQHFSGGWVAYEAHLLRLHELDWLGLLESEEAETVRDQMFEPWQRLTPEEQHRMAGLSADLHTLGANPPDLRIAPEEAQGALHAMAPAYADHEWEQLLYLLRRCDKLLPKERAAFMRGRCWSSLGNWRIAYLFFEAASTLDPVNANYGFLALEALFRSGRVEEALARARATLEGAGVHPRAVFGAAKVVFDTASSLPEVLAAPSYEAVIGPLRAAINREQQVAQPERLKSLSIAAIVLLAGSLQRLGRADEARKEYDSAVTEFPDSEELLTSRGLFLLAIDRRAGLRDLQALVKRNTAFVYPYLVLAHESLRTGRFEECVTLCDEGFQRAQTGSHKASLFQWSAIARHELGEPGESVRAMFETALVLDPLNEHIRANFELFETLAEAHGSGLSSSSDIPEASVGDAMTNMTKTLSIAA
jgi:tetratricopeptide (TPR) repeat protein